MLFWVAVLAGGGFAYLGIKKGFFPMWAITFNILVSVYLSVMLLPVIEAIIPDNGGQAYFYNCALSLLIIGILVFVVLQTIASNYFSGGFQVSFPVIFNNIVAAILGFISGYLICCTVLVIISIMPFTSQSSIANKILGPQNLPAAVTKPVIGACDFIGVASMQVWPDVAQDAVDDFLVQREARLKQKPRNEEPEYDDTY